MVGPYTQSTLGSNKFCRTFSDSVAEDSLVWHRDECDRCMKVLEVGEWYFQRDNIMPLKLDVNDELDIGKMEYHRLIKSSGKLIVEITEFWD